MTSMNGGALVLEALGSGGALSPGSGGTLSLDIPFSGSLAGRVPFNSSLAGWVFHGNGEALSLDNRGALSLGIPFNSSLADWVPFNSSLAGWVFHAFSSRYKLELGSMLACTCSGMGLAHLVTLERTMKTERTLAAPVDLGRVLCLLWA